MKLTNRWNLFIYRLWAPVYDKVMDGHFREGRRASIEMAGLKPGERVLLVGIGTGADLTLLPPGVTAVGVDLSPDMLAVARTKIPIPGREIEIRVADAMNLPFEDNVFDCVVLSLIVSVVPDASRCMTEALRVVRPGGRAVIFDKFLNDDERPSIRRRISNFFATLMGTDINRRLADMTTGLDCTVTVNKPSMMNGLFRNIRIDRPA